MIDNIDDYIEKQFGDDLDDESMDKMVKPFIMVFKAYVRAGLTRKEALNVTKSVLNPIITNMLKG